MLKQPVPPIVSSSVNGLNTQSNLPPLNTLPHWTRVNTLSRTCPPKLLLRDRAQNLPGRHAASGTRTDGTNVMEDHLSFDNDDTASVDSRCSTGRRALQLEHYIAFLRHQHDEILTALHEEVDRLKRENRDLQFQLIIADERSTSECISDKSAGVRSDHSSRQHGRTETEVGMTDDVGRYERRQNALSSSGRRPGSRSKVEERKLRGLEAEVLELRQALKDEKHRNLLLEEQLEHAKSGRLSDGMPMSDDGIVESSTRVRIPKPPAQPRSNIEQTRRPSVSVPVAASSEPTSHSVATMNYQGEMTSSASSQLHSVEECHEFIRKLESDNNRQAQELKQLKSDLRDALYSQKWTPDAFLLAKAYVAADGNETQHPLHRIPLRPSVKKLADTLTLPPMKLALGNKATNDRSKRSQHLLNRSRLDHELVTSHDISDSH